MLILTRKKGQHIVIGDNILITIVEIKGGRIRIGIEAPDDLSVHREEIYQKILEQTKTSQVIETPKEGFAE